MATLKSEYANNLKKMYDLLMETVGENVKLYKRIQVSTPVNTPSKDEDVSKLIKRLETKQNEMNGYKIALTEVLNEPNTKKYGSPLI